MSSKRFFALSFTVAFYLFLALGSLTIAGGEQGESIPEAAKLSIFGYEGVLYEMDVAAAIREIKELGIGQPPFLKDLDAVEDYGVDSCLSGVLQKDKEQVWVFKLKFGSEDQALSSINLKMQRSPHRARPPLTIEDPKNCRNSDFGLFFDGTYWSGFRREKEVLALMRGAVSQEDFFHIMERVIPVTDLSAAAGPEPIRIGLIGTFSGPLEIQGIDMRDGALLALSEVRQMKEMRGQSFELIMADDKHDPDEAVRQAKRLIKLEKVGAILGPVDSACALALVPVVSEARIPMITLATQPEVTRPLRRYVFRGNISDDDLGKLIADYTKIIFGGDRIALLYEDTPYGNAGMEVVRQRLKRVGVEPVATESYVSGDMDFGAQMATFKEAEATNIIVYGTMMDAQTIMQWIRNSGLEARVIASSGWASTHLLSMVSKGLDGVVVAGYAHLGELDADMFPAWLPFYRTFLGEYGRKPDLIAGYAYSNMMCLLEAMERVKFNSTRIIEGLEATENFQTVFNHFITYHDENHDGMRYINFSTYREGRVELATKDKSLDATKMREKGPCIEVAGYRGELSPMPPNTAAYFVIHMGFGYPRFMRESREMGLYGGFRSDYNFYGMKYAYSGTLFKGKDKVVVVKMAFRSPERAIAVLDLEATKEALGDKGKIEKRPEEMRDTESGVSYADGLWSAYQRRGATIVFAKGEVPLEDLKVVLEATLRARR